MSLLCSFNVVINAFTGITHNVSDTNRNNNVSLLRLKASCSYHDHHVLLLPHDALMVWHQSHTPVSYCYTTTFHSSSSQEATKDAAWKPVLDTSCPGCNAQAKSKQSV